MKVFMDVLQLIDGIVRIYLRSGQTAVPEQFFYGIKFRAIIGQMRGKAVPQHMRTTFFYRGYEAEVLFYGTINTARRQRQPFNRYK